MFGFFGEHTKFYSRLFSFHKKTTHDFETEFNSSGLYLHVNFRSFLFLLETVSSKFPNKSNLGKVHLY